MTGTGDAPRDRADGDAGTGSDDAGTGSDDAEPGSDGDATPATGTDAGPGTGADAGPVSASDCEERTSTVPRRTVLALTAGTALGGGPLGSAAAARVGDAGAAGDGAVAGADDAGGGGAGPSATASQLAKLLPEDGDAGDAFGSSVSVSGDGAAVVAGAPADEGGNDTEAGSAYVFDRSGGWSQTAKLVGDGDDVQSFGRSVSMASGGGTVAVGAWKDDNDDGPLAGSAYVYGRSGGGWSRTATLAPEDRAAFDSFGFAVALSGDASTAAVTAPNEDEAGDAAGAAYVFRAGDWTQTAKLTAGDADADDRLGRAVALDGDGTTAVVGADRDEDPNGVDAGAAYVFERSDGNWTQAAKLTADDGRGGDRFGFSVAVAGDGATALAGAPLDSNVGGGNAGAAYVFERAGEGWRQTAKLRADDADGGDEFGRSVSVAGGGGAVAVGARGDEDPNGSDGGAGYVLERSGDGWTQRSKVAARLGDGGDRLGSSVGLSGDVTTVLAGAPGEENPNGTDAGAAYAFGLEAPNEAPTAAFEASDTDVTPGTEVSFDAGASEDPDGSIATYRWDLDDDGDFETTGEAVSRTYDASGEFRVTLEVVDDEGASSRASRTVSVNAAPSAAFDFAPADPVETPTYTQTGPVAGQPVAFDAGDSGDGDGSVRDYEWDFDGDGSYERTGRRVEHTFDSVGETTVTLRVTDDDGATATTSRAVPVGLRGRPQKLGTAARIDARSVLAAVERETGAPFEGEFPVVESTLDGLRAGLDDGSVAPDAAAGAVDRLRAVETAALSAVDRFGPAGDGGVDVAARTARSVADVAVPLTLVALSTAAATATRPGALGATGSALAGTVLDAVDDFLADLLGRAAADGGDPATTGTDLHREAARRVRRRAQSVFDRIAAGDLSEPSAVADAVDAAAADVAAAIADGIRALVEFGAVAPAFGDLPPGAATVGALLGPGESVYRTLLAVADAMAAENVASGLRGSTASATMTVENGAEQLRETVADSAALLDGLGGAGDRELYATLVAAVGGDGAAAGRLASAVVGALDAVGGGVLDALASSSAVAGYALAAYVRRIHRQFGTVAVRGRGVTFVDV